MLSFRNSSRLFAGIAISITVSSVVAAQEARPWRNPDLNEPPARLGGSGQQGEAYQPSGSYGGYGAPPRAAGDAYSQSPSSGQQGGYNPQPTSPFRSGGSTDQPSYGGQSYGGQGQRAPYGSPQASTRQGYNDAYRPPTRDGYGSSGASPSYGAPYSPAPGAGNDDENGLYDRTPERRYEAASGGYNDPPPRRAESRSENGYYTKNEIMDAGHGFFGSVTRGLASAVEWTWQNVGRPNGYILGEDAGGAFVAGLRYGEGVLNTKDAGRHKVYWQGPSLGYDIGAEGSKTMVLIYNLRDPSEIYTRLGGVQGAAYLIGGVSVQLQKYGDVVLAVIRSGVGVRLGANVGYLKYTRTPTWNPF